MDIQTYRYGVCGASNTALDIFLYFVSYNFILNKQIVSLAGFSISPHIAAFLMAFSITAPAGFLLMRIVVFPESTIKGWVQLSRYFSVVALNLFLNYVLLKLFVDVMNFYPTPAKILNTALIVAITFILQKYFTFRVKKIPKKVIPRKLRKKEMVEA
ncbi:GtrA family protein [Cytophagaceae bacterium ABcell3]|nr:GtrA family protein [Cytophagaceae bacterium ABcell3]